MGGISDEEQLEQRQRNVIAHFDVDCFYAQVEQKRLGLEEHMPVVVVQKHIVVTCNYAARKLGVEKLELVENAKRKCRGKEVAFVDGSDLSPYRSAARQINRILETVGGAVEARGMDEAFVDLTQQAMSRLMASAGNVPSYAGEVLDTCCHRAVAANRHRPGDLALLSDGGSRTSSSVGCSVSHESHESRLLRAGSAIVQEVRTTIKRETGFTVSAGIAHSKVLAKLASGMHKPNNQTSIPANEEGLLLAQLKIQSLNGIGYRTASVVREVFDAEFVHELLHLSEEQLAKQLMSKLSPAAGARTARIIFSLIRGVDLSPVTPRGPAQSVSVEDSFKAVTCRSEKDVTRVLSMLVPDLIDRLQNESADSRVPLKLTLKWRYAGGASTSSTCAMPPIDARKLLATASAELRSKLSTEDLSTYGLTKLTVTASGFVERTGGDRRPRFETESSSSLGALSKRGARLMREGVAHTGRFDCLEEEIDDGSNLFEDLRSLAKDPGEGPRRQPAEEYSPRRGKRQRGITSFFMKGS